MPGSALLFAAALGTWLAADPSLVRPLGEAEVDWAAGTVRARAGAAADIRMPSADVARPGAERRAKARALELMEAALRELPLGAGRKPSKSQIEGALARARATNVEYQSNGGVVIEMQITFDDLADRPSRPADAGAPEPAVLSVGSMGFEAQPLLVCGRREEAAPAARYRMGEPPPGVRVLAAKVKHGRLVLPEDDCGADLASRPAVIYVRKAAK